LFLDVWLVAFPVDDVSGTHMHFKILILHVMTHPFPKS
jgi:hypothetical protein